MCGVHVRRGRKHQFGHDLVRTQIVLPFVFGLWNGEEFFQWQFALALRSLQPDFRPVRNQDWHHSRRTDKFSGTIVSENGVVAVFATGN